MPNWDIVSRSQEETIRAGRELAARLRPPVVVLLSGDLGAGKTTMAKGIINGLGAAREEDVTSPTFTLVHVFRNSATGTNVYHVDLYRVGTLHDFETLGLEDAFSEPSVVIVEWAERLALRTDWPRVEVRLQHLEEQGRRIQITVDEAARAQGS
jgi:tRNA threonylcarbamoyladenosine biosynthesis protein TsaE